MLGLDTLVSRKPQPHHAIHVGVRRAGRSEGRELLADETQANQMTRLRAIVILRDVHATTVEHITFRMRHRCPGPCSDRSLSWRVASSGAASRSACSKSGASDGPAIVVGSIRLKYWQTRPYRAGSENGMRYGASIHREDAVQVPLHVSGIASTELSVVSTSSSAKARSHLMCARRPRNRLFAQLRKFRGERRDDRETPFSLSS